jgi:outer membrane protein TolC
MLACANRTLSAQHAHGDSTTTTLGSLYRMVAAESPRLTAARASARAAAARVSSAKLPPDPQLQFGLMNRTLWSLQPDPVLGMTQIQLMQMLPVAGKLGLAGHVAEAQAAAADERANDVQWDVRSRVAMAFYDLYQADRSLTVAVDTRRLLQNIAQTAQTMYAVGDGRQPDVLRANVEVARMTEDIIRMQAMRVSMVARLNAMMAHDVVAASAQPALPSFPAEIPPLDSLQQMAEAHRPMLMAGEQDVLAALAAERLARREIWPDLQVGIQYGHQSLPMGTQNMGSLMIGATLPIFARSRQLKMREEAAAMRAEAEADLTAMRAETRGRVGELRADYARARNLSTLYRSTILPQAGASVTSSFAAYRVGEVNFMTLLDNQMTVNKYSQELFALEADEGKTLAELEMLIGHAIFDVDAVAGASTPAMGGVR